MTTWILKSVQVGMPKERHNGKKTWITGIDKQPVQGAIHATEQGLAGDGVGDTNNHGGPDKAICAHAWQHYEFWNAYFQWSLTPGAFGENITLIGLSEVDVCIGDVWQVGTTKLQVTQPRIPCWQQSDKLGQKGFEKLVMQTGRSGFYLRVLKAGQICAGDVITPLERPHPEANLVRLNRALVETKNMPLAEEFVQLPPLSQSWQEMFAERLSKTTA